VKIGEKLLTARKARQMTLNDVAKALDISAMAVSKYENNQVAPNSTMLIKLSKVLAFPVSFFFSPNTVELTKLAYRKKSRLLKSEEEAIDARAQDWVDRYRQIEGFFELKAKKQKIVECVEKMRHLSLGKVEDAEIWAQEFREIVGIGRDAIENMVGLLEDIGVKVIFFEADRSFDAVSFREPDGGFVIVSNNKFPLARSRFTLAHELGHILFSQFIPDTLDEEKVANRFAGALLVTQENMFDEIGVNRTGFSIKELISLKKKYGMSMNALVYRSKDLGIITESFAQQVFRKFRQEGWHRIEPDELNIECLPEKPQRMERMVGRLIAEELISCSRARELLGYEPSEDLCEVI